MLSVAVVLIRCPVTAAADVSEGIPHKRILRKNPQRESSGRILRQEARDSALSFSFPGYDAGADGATLRAPDTPNQGVSRVCLAPLGLLPWASPLGLLPWASPLGFPLASPLSSPLGYLWFPRGHPLSLLLPLGFPSTSPFTMVSPYLPLVSSLASP